MKVWVITDRDYDNSWIVAVYPSEAMALEHETLMGGYVEECEVLDALHPDAVDPAKQAERAAEIEKSKREWADRRAREKADAKVRAETRPRPPYMSLCHCETFSTARNFVNAHGYCGYCGGFVPEIFREHMGEQALHVAIDALDIHKREKMRAIVARLHS